MSQLTAYIDKTVTVITSDGRTLIGTLLGHDQTTNLILQNTRERIFQTLDTDVENTPSEIVEHGLYLIRGDNVLVCGLVDEKMDAEINWTKVRAQPFGTVKHAT
ncbi:hypothetical protein AOL_s00173g153 [Orbilia oligospora ATCC 24927]|uniref:LSM2-LSM8 complex subunit LSM8 n=2 Tax=Orbilia oligospora TaxID=2813651 RepID=G1XNY5_ARTOA|nr:hypothetical protein AOL_s00173g153 [Orbilia oligospora ATCC 24927]EGX45052.1 hypothetical protein AOL_s00173g153 [Orbilia oligospora ATCC 24927]KAF3286763.1 hypothetical protein TWF970_008603 [Orbilia oligospora]